MGGREAKGERSGLGEGATVNGQGQGSCRRINGVTRLRNIKEVVGKGEEEGQTRESEKHSGEPVKNPPLAKLSD